MADHFHGILHYQRNILLSDNNNCALLHSNLPFHLVLGATIQLLCEPKVGNFHGVMLKTKNIPGSQVSMNDL